MSEAVQRPNRDKEDARVRLTCGHDGVGAGVVEALADVVKGDDVAVGDDGDRQRLSAAVSPTLRS